MSHEQAVHNEDPTVALSRFVRQAARADQRPLPEILRELGIRGDDQVLAAILADLPEHWQHRGPLPVEQYLEWFPKLRRNSAAVLDIIYAEWMAREAAGELVDANEFCARFPDLADDLRKLHSVHQVLALPGDPKNDPQALAIEIDLGDDTDEEPAWGQGTIAIPGYQLIRPLGRGGFGEVWEARGPGDVPLALKRVRLNHVCGDSEHAALGLLKHVRHPHLISLHAYWLLEHDLIMAFELADESLKTVLEREHSGGMSAEATIPYLMDAAEALDFLARPIHRLNSHAVSIQHRDIKPANLLLQGGAIKVADYGLARALESVVDQQTHSLTVPYAPPEFFRGETTAHSDQYSLGITYYELRTGRRPFTGTIPEIIDGHLQGTPALDGLHEHERAVVARALAKQPAERWAGCIKFMGEVERAFTPMAVTDRASQDATEPPQYAGIPVTTGMLLGKTNSEPLPLKQTAVRVGVTAATAETSVTQVFANQGDRPVEATYVFPLPEDAAVHRLQMTVGERTIEGIVAEKEEARRTYERARQEGHGAALVEQTTPNIFTNSVANILPGQEIQIEIHYLQPLPFQDGQYRFVFPMVVSPRYALGESDTAETLLGAVPEAIRTPYLPPRVRRGDTVTLEVDLDAGVPLCGFDSPSHDIVIVEEDGESRVRIRLRKRDEIPNRDFVLNYRVAGPQIAHAMFYEPEAEQNAGSFLLLTTPPGSDTVTRQPRDIIVVLDRSGSMGGEPLSHAKQAVKQLIDRLEPEDCFNIIAFDNEVTPLAGAPLQATGPQLRRAHKFLDTLCDRGGTEMLEPLRLALQQPQANADGNTPRMRTVIFLTDGSVYGERELLEKLRDSIGSTRIIGFGIGTAVNRHLLNKLTAAGRGFAEYIYPGENIARIVDRTLMRLARPVLTDIELDWDGQPVAEVIPESCPDLFRGQPLMIVGRYQGEQPPQVTIRGRLGSAPYRAQIRTEQLRRHTAGVPLTALWARQQIEALMDRIWEHPDQQEELKREVIRLALAHRLASQFTSFVAIEYRSEQEREQAHDAVKVSIPQHMPAGMFDADSADCLMADAFDASEEIDLAKYYQRPAKPKAIRKSHTVRPRGGESPESLPDNYLDDVSYSQPPENYIELSTLRMMVSGCSQRARKGLALAGIGTISELTGHTADELLRIPGFEESDLQALTEMLAQCGLSLAAVPADERADEHDRRWLRRIAWILAILLIALGAWWLAVTFFV